jgi:hypothetical protein
VKPKTFREVTLALLDEGALMAQAEAEWDRVQHGMAAYHARYGDRAVGEVGTLTIKIRVKIEDDDLARFSIKGTAKGAVPNFPPSVSQALADVSEDGEPVMLCRASGTSAGNPRQGKLFTNTGRPISTETGEPADEPAEKNAEK